MMWLVPSALAVAAIAATAVVALHFIARSRPLAEPLPTARFIPPRSVHARARSVALTDIVLLLLRVAAVAAMGIAAAAPVFAGRGRVARIVMVDRSRDVASMTEVRDSARAIAGRATMVVPFDSASVTGTLATVDTLHSSDARGSLSAAFARAMRAAARVSSSTDSVELVLVSPFAREEVDDASLHVRAAWPGRVRLVPVAAARVTAEPRRVAVRADPNDAVLAGLSLGGLAAGNENVRIVRGALAPGDSAWARDSGRVLVHWPASAGFADWPNRSTIDAIGGVTSSSGTLVARFPRLWVLTGTPVARWADGEPAAVESPLGAGCVRHVGILIDESSDVTLRAPFRRFVAGLVTPCGGRRDTTHASARVLAALAGGGALAPAVAVRDDGTAASRATPWFYALAALLLMAEIVLRRTKVRAS